MGTRYLINSIKTRGSSKDNAEGFAETFHLGCSKDGVNFLFVAQPRKLAQEQVDAYAFIANTDEDSEVTNYLSAHNLMCTHVRYYPQRITGNGATALELFGGNNEKSLS